MTISTLATSLKNQLDAANPSTLSPKLAQLKIGSAIRAMPTQLNHKTTALSSYINSTYKLIVLPDDAKAAQILAAYGLVGTATAGPFTIATYASSTHPAANEISVGPTGDLVFLAADAWTSVDVLYVPAQYDVYELILPIASNAAALPTGTGQIAAGGAMLLMEAEILTGTTTGKCEVKIPASSNSGSLSCCLNLAKTSVLFTSGDAALTVRLKIAVKAATDRNALLEAASTSP